MKVRFTPLVVCVLAIAMAPAAVRAGEVPQQPAPPPQGDQPQPESVRRPFRGLFGAPSPPDAPQSLVLSASAFGAYDENVLAGIANRPTTGLDPRLQRSGYYSGAEAGLRYSISKTGQRASFQGVSDAQTVLYRTGSVNNFVPQYHAAAGLSIPLGRATTLGVSQVVNYSQYYRFSLLPAAEGVDEDAIAIDPSLELFSRTAVGYTTSVSLNRRVGKRSSINAAYGLRQVNYLDRQFVDFRGQSASIGFSRQLTSHATLRLGYRYRVVDATTITSEARRAHDVDAGVDYGRALSISRRTFVSFSSGSTILVRDDLTTTPGSDPRLHVRLTGNASLRHELGRTWSMDATYRRGLVFHEGFEDPFFVDSATAGIGGLLSRRLDFSAAAGWSFSTLDGDRGRDHRAVSTTAQTRYALNRYLALFARYAYYRYRFGAEVPLDDQLPRALNRNGVRVGVTASVPLLR